MKSPTCMQNRYKKVDKKVDVNYGMKTLTCVWSCIGRKLQHVWFQKNYGNAHINQVCTTYIHIQSYPLFIGRKIPATHTGAYKFIYTHIQNVWSQKNYGNARINYIGMYYIYTHTVLSALYRQKDSCNPNWRIYIYILYMYVYIYMVAYLMFLTICMYPQPQSNISMQVNHL